METKHKTTEDIETLLKKREVILSNILKLAKKKDLPKQLIIDIIQNAYKKEMLSFLALAQIIAYIDKNYKPNERIKEIPTPAKPDGADSKNTGYSGHTVPSGLNREESEIEKDAETGGRLSSEVKNGN